MEGKPSYAELLQALRDAEAQITRFCDKPDDDGCVIAPDSLERIRLREYRQIISRAEAYK